MTYTLEANENQIAKIHAYYAFFSIPSKNQYARYMFKLPKVTITVYNSNKVVFQGEASIIEYEKWQESKAVKLVTEKVFSKSTSSIGSDEVGTGDYFGPIIVVSAYIDEPIKQKLANFSITDSKKLTDKYILEIGEILKRQVPHKLLICDNKKFNSLHQKGYNMNKIKALMHNRALYDLAAKKTAKKIIVDQFTSVNSYFRYLKDQEEIVKDITFETKAESKYFAVAAASIIARYSFLKYFEDMKKATGYNLLKGASSKVDEVAAKIIEEKGLVYLYNISKISFKNTKKALAIYEQKK